MTRTTTPAARHPRLLQTLINLRHEETGPVLIAALLFCVLTALMLATRRAKTCE